MHLTHLLTIALRLRTPYSWLQAIDAESCTGDNILAEGGSAIPDKFFIKLERFLKHEQNKVVKLLNWRKFLTLITSTHDEGDGLTLHE